MCGISGIVDLTGKRDIDRSLLQLMNDRQLHRGPDGSGYHFEPGVGFGHRRLSIIDLAGGAQPMFNEDESVVLTYNGEIYDFVDLMDELRAAGYTFKSRCDSEVIVHGWDEWGASCVDRLQGMFAFAIWDRNRQSVFLARDRFGKKPLYYTVTSSGYLVFGSELKVLLAHPDVDRTLDPTSVQDYTTLGYVPDPKTIYANVKKLPPGHCLTARRGERLGEPAQYWNVRFAADAGLQDERDVAESLRSELRNATRKRMIADVPLGAFLSGGVDSSAVVAMMSEISDEPVNTCSISFGDPAFNESQFARQLATQLGTNHREERVDTDDFALVDQIPGIYDEPFADSSSIPTYRVCELARKHVTVALSGDGGDEVFAGYRRHRWHMNEEKVRGVLPAGIRRGLFGALGYLYPKMDWAPRVFRAKSTLEAIARDSADAYLHSVSILPNDVQSKLFSDRFNQDLQGYTSRDLFREVAAEAGTDDALSKIQYLDMKTYLPGDILVKVDRASMANSLEVRVPLLDASLVSWACTIPSTMKLQGRQGKWIFKKAMEGSVPGDILYREKMGFGVPLAKWFRGALRPSLETRLLGDAIRESGIFDLRFVETLLRQHLQGVRDYSAPIWALLVFEGFLKQHYS